MSRQKTGLTNGSGVDAVVAGDIVGALAAAPGFRTVWGAPIAVRMTSALLGV